MVVLSGVLPKIGDLVLLPHWSAPADTWFRVLDVQHADAGDGWCELDGYTIMPDRRQRLGTHRVPVAELVVDRN